MSSLDSIHKQRQPSADRKQTADRPITDYDRRVRWLRLNPRARSILFRCRIDDWLTLALVKGESCRSTARGILNEMQALGLVEAQRDYYRQRAAGRWLYRLTAQGAALRMREEAR